MGKGLWATHEHSSRLTYCRTNLTGAAVDEVAKRSTGGEVSILFAGVELGDVTVVAGEDWRQIIKTYITRKR